MGQQSNRYYVEPGNPNIQPGLAGIGDVIQQNRDERQKKQEINEIMKAVSSNNPDKIADLMIKYPKRAKEIQAGFDMKKGVTEPIVMNAYQKAISDPANAQAYLDEASDEVEALGRSPDNLRADADMFFENPEAAIENVRATYAGLNPKGFKALQGESGKGADWLSAKTFAFGAGDGQMQRGVLDEQGNLKKVGVPYDPRNPYLDTGTSYVNPNKPGADVGKNLARAEFEKKEGVANQKFYDNYTPETAQIKGLVEENNVTKDLLNELSGLTKSSTAGFGSWLSSTPMTDSKYVSELKSTIQSRLAMTKMMALKAASSTGSTGFGALSEKELKLLTDFQGSLELAQDPKDIKKVIMRIYNSLDNSNRGLERKLKVNESKYNRMTKKYGKPDETVITQPTEVNDLVNKYAQ